MSEFVSLGEKLDELIEELKARYGVATDLTPEELTRANVESWNNKAEPPEKNGGYDCKICKNKGKIAYIDDEGNEWHRDCKCKVIVQTLKRAKRSGLGDILTDCTFDKFNTTEEWQKTVKGKAQSFCNDDTAKWFYIGGQVGSGKSHICTAIAAHYIKAGQEVKYMLWSEESKRLKAIVNDERYQDEISIYKDVSVLYIDDFLKVKSGDSPTTADINLAFEIINHRLLSRDKTTIISSEKMLEEIMDYDEATMSRIFQKAGDYKINIGKDKSKNYRLKNAEVL